MTKLQIPSAGGEIIPANSQLLQLLILESIRQPTFSDLMEQPPAELPSQQAVQRLLVPTKGHPAKVLLEAELRALEAGLRQRANQEAALTEVVRTWRSAEGPKFTSAFVLSKV